MSNMDKTIKRHLWSALITFLAAFLMALGTNLADMQITSIDVIYNILFGASMAGARAVVKLLNELLIDKK